MKTIKMLVMAMVVVFGFVVDVLASEEVVEIKNNITLIKSINDMSDEVNFLVKIESTNQEGRIYLTKDKTFILESDNPLNSQFTGNIKTLFRFDKFQPADVALSGEWDNLFIFGAAGNLANDIISMMVYEDVKQLLIQVDLMAPGSTVLKFNLDGLKPIYYMMSIMSDING